MTRPEDEFREFVGGFADPLSRLAFLLTAGTDIDAAELTNDALAQVRRQWREVETTGAPETQAVEALVVALPHRRKRGSRPVVAPDDARGIESPDDGRVAAQVTTQDGAADDSAAAPLAPVAGPAAPQMDSRADSRAGDEIDIEVLRDAVWTAWITLTPRLRVPLVFADASVASRRLAGIDVPESFASARRREVVADDAIRNLRARVVSDLPARAAAGALSDRQLVDVLDDTLRERAGRLSAPIDPYPLVLERLGHQRRRALTAVAAVVVVLAAAVTVAVRVSTPDKGVAADAAAAASRSGFLPAPQVVPSAAGATASAVSGEGPIAAPPGGVVEPVLVVPWLTRGTAARDSELIANLKSYFMAVHTDAIGQTQVLLATDTQAFRIAYVTANSPNGVIQSWFYGPVGSENLIEGSTSYGGSLLPDSVLADGLVDSSGRTEFVVIGPPDTTGMQLADFDFSKPAGPGFEPLLYQNGIAVKQLDAGSSASTLVLDVSVGTARFELKNLPDINLVPRFDGSIIRNGPPSASPLPTPSVERGHPDPTLVTEALQVAATWEKSSPVVNAHPVVVWGGTDAAGTSLVVLRVDTQVVDLIVLEWSGDAPGLHGEILIHATAPEVPVAFAYRALDGTRIGVIGSHGAVRAVLHFNGKVSAPVTLDSTGFASFRVTDPSPPPSNDATNGLDIVASVQLLDASGRVIASVPEPPAV
jgi:hypothetical protein